MGAHRDDPRIAAHVASVATRAQSATERLSSALLEHCWPGGANDRTESVALEWVRLWGPRAGGALPPPCGCRLGRCLVCN